MSESKQGKPLISLEDEENLAQLILALKRQKLSTQIPKLQVAERSKRLHNYYNIVEGRKLDQQLYIPGPRHFGYRPNINNEVIKPQSHTNVSDKEKEIAKKLQEPLKNFCFHFPKDTNSHKVIDFIDLTGEDDSESKTKQVTVSHNKENSQPEKRATGQNKIQLEKPKQRLDHMYFVLDTNVLIHSLYLLEDVANLVPQGTAGSMLYVPYMVIKELDKLKCNQLSFAARRAIKYLNDKFEGHAKIEAQSAVQDAQQLVDIDCPDDSIINCCLQLQQRVPHLMLLTSDNNLRLKAHASFLSVATCEQLTSYRSSWWSLQRDRRQQRMQRHQITVWA